MNIATNDQLAAEMGVSANQLDTFVEALRPRVAAGMTIMEAVADWTRAVRLMAEQAYSRRAALKGAMIDSGLYEDLRAAA